MPDGSTHRYATSRPKEKKQLTELQTVGVLSCSGLTSFSPKPTCLSNALQNAFPPFEAEYKKEGRRERFGTEPFSRAPRLAKLRKCTICGSCQRYARE